LSGDTQKREFQPVGPAVAAQKFILAWTAVLIIGFATGTNVSLRYLLPATPLLAVLMAGGLQGAEGARLIFSVRRILMVVLAALVLADAAAFFIVSQWPIPVFVPALACGLFLAGMVLLGLGALWQKSLSAVESLGVAILLFWPLLFGAAMPALLPDRAQQMAMMLLQTQSDASKPVLLVGDVKLAARVRVWLGKEWTIVQSDKPDFSVAANFDTVLLPDRDVPPFLNRGYQIQRAAFNVGLPPAGEWWPALKSRQLPGVLMRHGQKYCLATRS
jgi:4-amino-4-deoxy-L-arabinose transferase-like glycosyltransferase